MKRYVITDGCDTYIKKDRMTQRYVFVKSRKEAYEWSEHIKAKNVWRSLSRDLRKKCHIETIVDNETCSNREMIEVKHLAQEDQSQLSGYYVHDSQWITQVNETLKYLNTIDVRLKELDEMLNKINCEVTDMYHYIEFKKLDAAQGYKAYRKLHGILQKRRAIKDEIYAASAIKDNSIGELQFDIPIRMIEGMQTRKYEPRMLNEVFAGGL